ncbi:MAG: fasciclin domain-containing protein [Calothrix sp. SM1_7_51]|nr:fasciclin domain-containing protein [Calothrix sp. SM1_7_51]
MKLQKYQHILAQTLVFALINTDLLINFPNNANAGSIAQEANNVTFQTNTIVHVIANQPNLKTFSKAVEAAGLTEILSSDKVFTVFVPTDEAFAALPKSTLESLFQPENKELLRKFINYHIVGNAYNSRSFRIGQLKSFEGSSLDIGVSITGRVRVNNARVTQADIQAANGVIHIIDKVIFPQSNKSR